MVCIAVTRNGTGQAWRFNSKRDVRLCPIVQLDDICAETSAELLGQYGRVSCPEIAGLLPAGPRRESARVLLLGWAQSDGPRGELGAFEAAALAWQHLVREAPKPPSDPEQMVRVIIEDRMAMEGRAFRSVRAAAEKQETTMSDAAEKTSATRGDRIPNTAVIKVLAETNPKRLGSKSHERFGLYTTGMTVEAAKAAGIQAADLQNDSAKGFISITPSAEEAA